MGQLPVREDDESHAFARDMHLPGRNALPRRDPIPTNDLDANISRIVSAKRERRRETLAEPGPRGYWNKCDPIGPNHHGAVNE